LEVVNPDNPPERVDKMLRAFIDRLEPTASFRRRAWRDFQRALDPLASPKPLPRARA
jgi:hypothetical protein